MSRNSLRKQMNDARDSKADALAAFISGRRKIKCLTRRLRNAPVTSMHISSSTWSSRYTHMAYIYLYQRVASMKDCAPLLDRIDALPGVPEYEEQPNGWRTDDNKHDGTRCFTRSIILNGVNVNISLTAIPDEKAENAKCRRVIVGQKERTETHTEPVYEIICEE